MAEPITIALISAITAVIAAFLNYLGQRSQRKELKEQRKDLKEVKEQVVNDHATAKYPNTRDELTSVRERVEVLESKVDTQTSSVEHIRVMVGGIAERLALTDRNRKDVEDTLSSRDELTDDRLEAAINRHDLDMKRVEVEILALTEAIKAHPPACAAFTPTTWVKKKEDNDNV